MLTSADTMRFHERGYVAPLPALTSAEVAKYRSGLETFIDAGAGNLPATMKMLRTKAHLRCRALFDLVLTPTILDCIEAILGPDLLCRGSSVFLKEAGSDTNVAWHQDSGYWQLDPSDVVTAWVALSESTVVNGALEVLPGSHLGPLLPHAVGTIPGNILSRGQTITAAIDEGLVVPLLLRPGEMSLHHVNIAHRSRPNRSSSRRIGVAIRYVATHVHNTGGRRDSAMLVRGADHYHHFLPEEDEMASPGAQRWC